MDAYAAGAYTRAEEEFRAAVRIDPGMADAWLGLHALRSETSAALLAMQRNRDRFGEQRRRHRRPLSSWYWLGWWVQPVLEDSRDLALAHASHWLDGRHLPELERALSECPPADHDRSVRFLHACRSYLLKDWEQLIRDTDSLLDDSLLGIEAGLFGGMARVRLDMCGQAELPLATSLARCRSEQPQRKELRYWLARAYEGGGRSAAAVSLYRAVHRVDPGFMDTSARLAAITAEDGVDPALLEAPAPPGFQRPRHAGEPGASGPRPLPGGTGPGPDLGPDLGGELGGDLGGDLGGLGEQPYEGGYFDALTDPGAGEGPLLPGLLDSPPAPPVADPDAPEEPSAGGAGARHRAALSAASAPPGPGLRPERPGLDAALAELERMVGMEPVKRQVLALSAQLRMAQLRSEQGLPVQPPKRHFVFSGPSGTGKTTVARILGRVFYALGLLSGDHLVEAQRADLVGEFLGQTAVKANELIDSALDGVLFVDEAYSLANSGYSKGDAYGDEALQVLLKRAEDNRDRLVVILAGYPEGMNRLLAANPGLNSRFTSRVDFPSYRPAELTSIGQALAGADGDFWDEEATEELRSICAHVVREGWIDELGNGRFMRTLYEKSCAYRDLRLSMISEPPTRTDLATLRLPDVLQAYGELIDGRG
ncbi:AAA family ATPase [Streptacidiphilus sp. PB12-B1b]|uniref:AAA family ATPase n=1 Tax=Streptacidiphilus sp. PB12-B1b TaxID=2705012 RepID=UPI0015FE36F1|nr:AAA family ATPase [Streptacidiphilus sp. PB12-B1b]QMU80178.1 AAA family ATPase [Streptacidiphilus sp. PB12-B1b]